MLKILCDYCLGKRLSTPDACPLCHTNLLEHGAPFLFPEFVREWSEFTTRMCLWADRAARMGGFN